ncbi:MAG: DUF6090 family protein [Bacteroidota bacterium]
MLKFFRKIRKNLLIEGNFSKYLLYALGEIILVVIGILIALQIDNWNSEKKDIEAEKGYLTSLKGEFSINLTSLENTMKENEDLINALAKLSHLFNQDTLKNISEKEVALFLSPLAKEVVYYPSRGVTSDIISSGNLKLIRNNELRQKIASFDNTLKRIENQEKITLDLRNNIMQITGQNGSFSILFAELENRPKEESSFRPKSNKQLFSILELENNLELYKQVTQTTNYTFYAGLRKDLKEILTMIEQELN